MPNVKSLIGVLVNCENLFGITYKEVNVWVFVILWPILTAILIGIILMQCRMIRRLSKE